VVASTPFWETIGLGQIYGLLALPTTLAWLWLGRLPLASGVLIGLAAALKPNFLVWAALLALIGQRRVALAAVATALGLNLLAGVIFGPQVFSQWLAAVSNEQPNGSVANAALAGLLARLGWSQLVLIVDAIGLVALAALTWQRRPSIQRASSLALIGGLVFAPLAWVGYGLFLLPLFFEETDWTWLTLGAAALLLVPRLIAQDWASQSMVLLLTFGSAFTWAFVLLLVQQVRALGWQRAAVRMLPRGTPAPS
jgi:hypothetical protein